MHQVLVAEPLPWELPEEENTSVLLAIDSKPAETTKIANVSLDILLNTPCLTQKFTIISDTDTERKFSSSAWDGTMPSCKDDSHRKSSTPEVFPLLPCLLPVSYPSFVR